MSEVMEEVSDRISSLIKYISDSLNEISYEESILRSVEKTNTVVDLIDYRINNIFTGLNCVELVRTSEFDSIFNLIEGMMAGLQLVVKPTLFRASTDGIDDVEFQYHSNFVDHSITLIQSACKTLISHIARRIPIVRPQHRRNSVFLRRSSVSQSDSEESNNSEEDEPSDEIELPDSQPSKNNVSDKLVKIPLKDESNMKGHIYIARGSDGILIHKSNGTLKYLGNLCKLGDDHYIDSISSEKRIFNDVHGVLGQASRTNASKLINSDSNFDNINQVIIHSLYN